MQTAELKAFVIDKVDDLKAKDIVSFDMTNQASITDFNVICTGTSKTHVRAIAENALKEAKAANIEILGFEGKDTSEWVLVDFGDVILHVMQEETRNYYQLEKLWAEPA